MVANTQQLIELENKGHLVTNKPEVNLRQDKAWICFVSQHKCSETLKSKLYKSLDRLKQLS